MKLKKKKLLFGNIITNTTKAPSVIFIKKALKEFVIKLLEISDLQLYHNPRKIINISIEMINITILIISTHSNYRKQEELFSTPNIYFLNKNSIIARMAVPHHSQLFWVLKFNQKGLKLFLDNLPYSITFITHIDTLNIIKWVSKI